MATSKPFQSTKVDRTLRELESAFADWQSLVDPAAAKAGGAATEHGQSPEESEKDLKLRKKTQALLEQLREQLSELGK